jgi:alkylated DNA nucleotide flippase Atl1
MWQSPFKELPANNQVVWIRVLNIYGEIAVARYDAVNQIFTIDPSGLIIPAYMVSRWKPYP